MLHDLVVGARFLYKLPSFLRHPVTLEEARTILHQRLQRREADFLTIARRTIYGHPGSPYRDLLQLAGCEYGDLERLVRKDGVEEALRILYRHGVYLTVDEFKGRQPVVRGSTTMAVDPGQLRNPWSAFHVPVRSSGSRSTATPVLLDFAFVRDHAVNVFLVVDARGGTGWRNATWDVPGGAALFRLLMLSGCGCPPVRWFSQLDPAMPSLHARYIWSPRVTRWGSLLAGAPLPRPLHVSLDDPIPIAQWMVDVLRNGATPHLLTVASSAVRLCQAAIDAGIDLHGAQVTMSGEPVTEARLNVVKRAGAEAIPGYGSIECGYIGYGCLAPESPDDLHLLHDLHAMIQPGQDGATPGFPRDALFISSLRRTAPFFLLNVSMGDQAVMTRRACGCPLERLGWATHLRTIRSYDKLTSGGMALLDTDVIRVLEEALPARFGGAPTHYQLVEDEAEDGRPRLRLLVHPAVGPLDNQTVADTFLRAIGHGSGVERLTELLWRDARILTVERRPPLTTATGKILHLHTEHRSSERRSPGPRT